MLQWRTSWRSQVRTLLLMKMLIKQDQSFGIILKLMVFRADMVEPKILHAPFVILLSLGVLQLELLLIFLVELFSDKSDRMSELVYQNVKMEFFKEIWAQGKTVVIWIRGHQSLAAKFSKIASKSLLLPGDINLEFAVSV